MAGAARSRSPSSTPASRGGYRAQEAQGAQEVRFEPLNDRPVDIEKQSLSRQPLNGDPGGPGEPGGPPRDETEQLYKPKSLRFWLTLICNFLALFLVAIDRTIIATAVPRISDEFQALGDIGWYGSSYMLTTACAQLLFGRIYKFYDMKWSFLLSIIVFEIGSAICGAAPSSTVFIVGRAIAGLGSAGIFSGCLLIMIPMIPLHRRPAFQGMFGMVFGLASVMGPLIGGGFTGGVTWRWCFWINLPIGAVALIFMIFFWNPPKMPHERVSWIVHIKRLDPLGMFFFMPGTVSLFIAFQWAGTTYEWYEWRIIVLLCVWAACTIAFITVQIAKPETATIPPRVITQRSVAFGTAFTFFLAGSMLMLVYYVPVWFQTVKMVDPIKSGIYTLPLVLSLVVSSILSGGITQKIGYYVPSMIASPSIMSIGEGLLTTLRPDSPPSHWVSFQFLSGFGLGFGMQTSGLAIQTVLPREDVSTGIAINFFVQQLGGAVFTSVGQTILTNLLVSKLSHIPGFNPKAIVGEGATQLTEIAPKEYVPQIIEAYNYACRHIFFAAMGLAFVSFFCALGMEWRSIKKGRNGQGPPGPAKPPGSGGPPEPNPDDPGQDMAGAGAEVIKLRELKNSTPESSSADGVTRSLKSKSSRTSSPEDNEEKARKEAWKEEKRQATIEGRKHGVLAKPPLHPHHSPRASNGTVASVSISSTSMMGGAQGPSRSHSMSRSRSRSRVTNTTDRTNGANTTIISTSHPQQHPPQDRSPTDDRPDPELAGVLKEWVAYEKAQEKKERREKRRTERGRKRERDEDWRWSEKGVWEYDEPEDEKKGKKDGSGGGGG